MFSPLCITQADGWGPTLQSGGNQLIGSREIDTVLAANPSSPLTVHQSRSAITPLIGQQLIAGLITAASASGCCSSWVQGLAVARSRRAEAA